VPGRVVFMAGSLKLERMAVGTNGLSQRRQATVTARCEAGMAAAGLLMASCDCAEGFVIVCHDLPRGRLPAARYHGASFLQMNMLHGCFQSDFPFAQAGQSR